MSIKYVSTFFNLRPLNVYPNWDFGFENEPSGNPGFNNKLGLKVKLFEHIKAKSVLSYFTQRNVIKKLRLMIAIVIITFQKLYTQVVSF
jgi:hypothetical protein